MTVVFAIILLAVALHLFARAAPLLIVLAIVGWVIGAGH
jgi:hypothetical protein